MGDAFDYQHEDEYIRRFAEANVEMANNLPVGSLRRIREDQNDLLMMDDPDFLPKLNTFLRSVTFTREELNEIMESGKRRRKSDFESPGHQITFFEADLIEEEESSDTAPV